MWNDSYENEELENRDSSEDLRRTYFIDDAFDAGWKVKSDFGEVKCSVYSTLGWGCHLDIQA